MNQSITVSSYESDPPFTTPVEARKYMEEKRWGGKPSCPSCKRGERIYKLGAAGYYRCPTCKFDFTVRTGTIMERSHISLDKWLCACSLVMTTGKAITSVQLSKDIGITQKSAWFLLQRLREARGKSNDKHDQNDFLAGIIRDTAENVIVDRGTASSR